MTVTSDVDAFATYMSTCVTHRVWYDPNNPDTATVDATMSRMAIAANVAAKTHPGQPLALFTLQKYETAWFTHELLNDIVAGGTPVTVDELRTRFWNQPNHKRDLPSLILPLLAEDLIDAADHIDALIWAWQTPEYPQTDDNIDDWIAAFTRTGFICDEPGPCTLNYPLTIHHGAAHNSEPGMAWSTERTVAAMFAGRFERNGTIHTTTLTTNATGSAILYRPGTLHAGTIHGQIPLPGRRHGLYQNFTTGNSTFLFTTTHLSNQPGANGSALRDTQTRTLLAGIDAVNTAGSPVISVGDMNSNKAKKYAYDAPRTAYLAYGHTDTHDWVVPHRHQTYNSFNRLTRVPARGGYRPDQLYVRGAVVVTGTDVMVNVVSVTVRKRYGRHKKPRRVVVTRYRTPFTSDHNPVQANVLLT